MSFSSALRRTVLTGFLLSVAVALGGCSSTPVYSRALAEQSIFKLDYAKPASRLEQVVYQELSLRLGRSAAETAPLVSVTVSSSAADMMVTTTTNPAKPVEVTVTATITFTTRDGSDTPARSFTRMATAGYTRSNQVLADNAAAQEAAERAARSVAESLRLAVLAALSC